MPSDVVFFGRAGGIATDAGVKPGNCPNTSTSLHCSPSGGTEAACKSWDLGLTVEAVFSPPTLAVVSSGGVWGAIALAPVAAFFICLNLP